MNNSPKRIGVSLIVVVVLLALGAVSVMLFSERSRHAATLAELRREAADLRAQLEVRDQAVSALPTEVQQLRGGAFPDMTPATSSTDLELARRVSALALQQSNIAVNVERLLARISDGSSPVVSAERSKAAYAALEAATKDEQQRLELAKQKTAELLVSLSIPAEVSTMNADKALDTASLRPYWPYFEAKRERDMLREMVDRLQFRLMAERVQVRVDGAR